MPTRAHTAQRQRLPACAVLGRNQHLPQCGVARHRCHHRSRVDVGTGRCETRVWGLGVGSWGVGGGEGACKSANQDVSAALESVRHANAGPHEGPVPSSSRRGCRRQEHAKAVGAAQRSARPRDCGGLPSSSLDWEVRQSLPSCGAWRSTQWELRGAGRSTQSELRGAGRGWAAQLHQQETFRYAPDACSTGHDVSPSEEGP